MSPLDTLVQRFLGEHPDYVFEEVVRNHVDTDDFVDEFLQALAPRRAEIEERYCKRGETLKAFARRVQTEWYRLKIQSVPVRGRRVEVYDGHGKEFLGFGTYEEDVHVYVIQMPDGSLQSLKNAEIEPSPDEIPRGGVVRQLPKNPRIVLENGQVVYGCQVWWKDA